MKTPIPYTIARVAAEGLSAIPGAEVSGVKSLGRRAAAFQLLEKDGSVYEISVRVKTEVRPLSKETIARIREGIKTWSVPEEERARMNDILNRAEFGT